MVFSLRRRGEGDSGYKEKIYKGEEYMSENNSKITQKTKYR